MNRPALVMDTDAVLAYASGSFDVGERIARAADAEDYVIVPVLCLAEAYRRADSDKWRFLDILANLPATAVAPVEPDDAVFLGGHARKLGSKDLAHAVIEAATHWLTPIMTSQRRRVTEILPKEWPIIDL